MVPMQIPYVIKPSKRSRRVRIAVSGGRVVVTAPPRMDRAHLDRLVARHEPWIVKALRRQAKLTAGVKLERDAFDKNEFTARAKELVKARYLAVAAPHGLRLGKISVKKMRSRWGSCSGQGNISINLLLGHLPPELLAYVVVHEICHLVHHDHSKRFWALVAANEAAFKAHKAALRRYSHYLSNQ